MCGISQSLFGTKVFKPLFDKSYKRSVSKNRNGSLEVGVMKKNSINEDFNELLERVNKDGEGAF